MLSEYVPTAVNCWVEPATKLGGASGCTAIAVNTCAGFVVVVVLVGVVNVAAVVFDEQDTPLKAKAAMIPIVKHNAKNLFCFVFIITFPFSSIGTIKDDYTIKR